MSDCEVVREAMRLRRELEPAGSEHLRSCAECAREWRSHRALTEHYAAVPPPRVPILPDPVPMPLRRASGGRIPFRRALAMLRLYGLALILVSGWILQSTMPEATALGAVDRTAFLAGIVGLAVLTLAPMRSTLRILARAIRS